MFNSNRINKARSLKERIIELQDKIKLNDRALAAAIAADAAKYIIEDFQKKKIKLQREYEKASKRFFDYADENIKISELNKISEDEDELYEDY